MSHCKFERKSHVYSDSLCRPCKLVPVSRRRRDQYCCFIGAVAPQLEKLSRVSTRELGSLFELKLAVLPSSKSARSVKM